MFGYQIPALGQLVDLRTKSSPKIVQSTGEIPLYNIYMSDAGDSTIPEKEVMSENTKAIQVAETARKLFNLQGKFRFTIFI